MESNGGEGSADWTAMVMAFRGGVTVRDRKFKLRSFPSCFVGFEAVQWLVDHGFAANEEDAVRLGDSMIHAGVFHHVLREHSFKNENLFYRFAEHEDHGGVDVSKGLVSWGDLIFPSFSGGHESFQPDVERDLDGSTADHKLTVARAVQPLDKYNLELLDKVHPATWKDPVAKSKYHLVVIGAGAGGLVSAAGAAGVGAKVALIEAHLLGGDCLNVGCVPSKTLITSAKAAWQMKNTTRLQELGLTLDGEVRVDFGKVMERVRKVRAEIAENDSAARFATKLGVDVYLGYGQFISENTIEVNGQKLQFAKAVIATGGSPQIPPIEGMKELLDEYITEQPGSLPILTNETVFNLTELPPNLGVIGTGAIGLELAQSFQRLGSNVIMFGRSGRILPKDDLDLATILQDQMVNEGVSFHLNSEYLSVKKEGSKLLLVIREDGHERSFAFDAILVAAGRAPNVKGMGLEMARVKYDLKEGIKIGDNYATSNSNIFAVGDCASAFQFTHVADFMARAVIRNALFFGKEKFSSLIVPWCTYTEPEVAHVGIFPKDASSRGFDVETYEKYFKDNDRAISEGETQGVVRIHVKKGSDTIIGASVVGSHAGDLISEITLAMNAGVGLGKLASVIHPYPTEADAIRACGDLYNRTRLTLPIRGLFRQLLRLKM
uniref:DEP domain-containing protein n=1 Tax=Compsopogon caeruleus TaxID=31354 RepID=A0A7S1TCV4_9RHOD|mmetsp:Transcript_17347/g.36022  ORF Transcript_17347/g.36022 Transcript_17347/m.36022 type:complete len:663 (+) Transcript_17347:144-2132(+)|eukprot:CAMPEP_0184684686 /NCGR_PEP_ID=MMETSP0312-20130426/16293_1 /TAXON_ID=31354 /ORGANISM="Compsopogon coeruleus, Strain SAG 36.94" /LENGTH=662 /DNA_ID=CAMNT_0027138121 /DNA_START=92 /DNA_END=2080 /DNA_ORIENTATION=-